MFIGFTGTRTGMTPTQKAAVFEWLHDRSIIEGGEFHHGDCVGADVEAASIAYTLGYRIICHPPLYNSARGFFPHNHEVRKPKDYLLRNRDIVDECQYLLAAPEGPETRRSGTWSTVRYARKVGAPVKIAQW